MRANIAPALLGFILAGAGVVSPASAQQIPAAVTANLDGRTARLDAIYQDLHAHPELGFAEQRTAALLSKEMRALGFEVTEKIGKTGLVAIYRNGPGPTVLVRTDMDALPLREQTGLPYASTVETQWNGRPVGVMHACGHDLHMAAWLGAAGALLAAKDQWSGTLMFVAQPSEEGGGGAKAMLADGLFTRFGTPDYAFALHTSPVEAGTVQYRAGVISSNSDTIDITFKGRGGHGSDPSTTIDPVLMAARFVVDVQGVVAREKDPQEAGVVTIGAIEAGSAANIIPEQALVRGTIRSFDARTREKLVEGTARVARAAAAMSAAPEPAVAITRGYDAVVNDAALTDRIAAVFKGAFGDKATPQPRAGTASEDYSDFVNAGVPKSVFFTIGVLDPAKVAAARRGEATLAVNHSPQFAPVAEPSIRTGATAMALAVIEVLRRP